MTEELVIPGTGQLVDLKNEMECAQALRALRDFEEQIRSAKSALSEAIIERSRILGTKTIHLPDGMKAEIKGGTETVYDAQEIETQLRALGMPEERIREIVVETVSYKVSAKEAKRAAGANEDYAAVIDGATTVNETTTYVSITKR